MDSKKSNDGNGRQPSRLRREMLASRQVKNPFSSPPSSSGSHGTISNGTLGIDYSDFSLGPPDAESTNLFDAGYPAPAAPTQSSITGRFAPKSNYNFNTPALKERFPVWHAAQAAKEVQHSAPAQPREEIKENLPPITENITHNTTSNSIKPGGYLTSRGKTQAMQASVQNESDMSTIISHITPFRAAGPSGSSRFSRRQPSAQSGYLQAEQGPSLQAVVTKVRSTHSTVRDRSDKTTAKTAKSESLPTQILPKLAPPPTSTKMSAHTADPSDDTHTSPTARSFFVPSLSHLPDWTSGTLKFSTMKNGIPVFVKRGKARMHNPKLNKHLGDMNALELPEDEEEIFVSMDKLRDEVVVLQQHDSMVRREAEKLQEEVKQLQDDLHKARMGRSIDSAIGSGSGSESESSIKQRLATQKEMSKLQAELDEAKQQISVHKIHYSAVIAERDDALQRASSAETEFDKLRHRMASLQAVHATCHTEEQHRAEVAAIMNQVHDEKLGDIEALEAQHRLQLQVLSQQVVEMQAKAKHGSLVFRPQPERLVREEEQTAGHQGVDQTIDHQDSVSVRLDHHQDTEGSIDQQETSAFFVPDITLETNTRREPSLSKNARKVLNELCHHDHDNCNVCVRMVSGSKRYASTSKPAIQQATKKSLKVEKPVPVSKRVVEIVDDYEEEPTTRPSQPPGQALAIMIKGLKDELQHLDQQLEVQEKKYRQHDKSLGQRERRRLAGEIKRLGELRELKSEQIYAAYDVLEGLKRSGQEMTTEELEVTIASIMG